VPTAVSAEPVPATPVTAPVPARPPRITIVGAGSLGLALVAALGLARAGNGVTIMARAASASALLEAGQVTVSGQFEYSLPTSGPPLGAGQV
jgi:threonine dehydrogenase-like Zn-dependent dehydrogenase